MLDETSGTNDLDQKNSNIVPKNISVANISEVSTTIDLNEEAKTLVTLIANETDVNKTRDLTQLFNNNQNKKTIARVDKLSNLLDVITDQALTRFTARPDEISNKELFDGLKIVQDLIERGQKQVSGPEEAPLIQVNQQTNEVNIGDTSSKLNRESRERVKSAVLGLLNNITNLSTDSSETLTDDKIISQDITDEDNTDE